MAAGPRMHFAPAVHRAAYPGADPPVGPAALAYGRQPLRGDNARCMCDELA
jgi:hypothetical protein